MKSKIQSPYNSLDSSAFLVQTINKTTVTYISQAISLLTSCDAHINSLELSIEINAILATRQTANGVRERETETREVQSKKHFKDRRPCLG